MNEFDYKSEGFTNFKRSDQDEDQFKKSVVWSTEKINNIIEQYQNGEIEIRGMKSSPFLRNDIDTRKPGLVFEYTKEEREEIEKCKADPLYFAEKYAFSMTEEGLQLLKYRPYQKAIIRGFQDNRFNILMAARQCGKTITSATFLVWFLLFQKQKNALVVADVYDTTKEIIDKMKAVIKNLPFFMKPGLEIDNVTTMKFENGSRLIGRTTTKKTGIGFTIHLLYMDEFAHIDGSFLNYFYRSIYPTISSMKNSKIIITSTPNGTNRFYQIWRDSIDKKNGYHPMRVDWWQVPGRDEEWKKETIANLGSEEDFKQEYGLQFFAGDDLLLNSVDVKKMDFLKTNYESVNWDVLNYESGLDVRENFRFHPKFKQTKLQLDCDLRNDRDKYLAIVDSSDGVGADYSVINIFRVVPMPIHILQKHRTSIKKDMDIFGLVQVGTFRSNKVNIENFSRILSDVCFRFFNPQNLKVIIELNHQGKLIKKYLEEHGDYFPGMLVHTKHTVNSKYYSPGLILNSHSTKMEYCENFRHYVSLDKILMNEFHTVEEVSGFGKVGNSYRSQLGNDDLAITCVNASSFFGSPQFYEMCEDIWDEIEDDEYIETIEKDFIDWNMEQDNKGGNGMESSFVNDLNSFMN
jgi:hypothetical protein